MCQHAGDLPAGHAHGPTADIPFDALTRRLPLPLEVVLLPAPYWPAPCRAWSGRLAALEHAHARLHYANAYVSTLGGGYFLCRYVGDAVRMALAQLRVSRALGETGMEARCCVHLVYCCIQAGQFRTAARLLRLLARLAAVTGDEVLGGMCTAGQRYCRGTAGAYAEGKVRVQVGSRLTVTRPAPAPALPAVGFRGAAAATGSVTGQAIGGGCTGTGASASASGGGLACQSARDR